MIPLVLLGISVVAGIEGVVEGAGGIGKLLDAKEIVDRSKKLYERNLKLVKREIDRLNKELETVNKLKRELILIEKEAINLLKSLNKQIKLKEIELNNEKLRLDSFTSKIEEKIQYAEEIFSGLIKAASTSYFSYFGAVNIATLIGTASTGTPIAVLSGAAAENAVLAWFGGGSVAAGGGGVALGGAVLSGIAAGPAIFFIGKSISESGEKALTQAKEFKSKVKLEVEKMRFLRKIFPRKIKDLKVYQNAVKAVINKFQFLRKEANSAGDCSHWHNAKYLERKIVSLATSIYLINELLEVNLSEVDGSRINQQLKELLNEVDKNVLSSV